MIDPMSILIASALASALGIYRKDQKFQDVQAKQKRFSDQERAKRKMNYAKSTDALNEALATVDKDSGTFVAPNAVYTPDEFVVPTTSNMVVSDTQKGADNVADFQLSQFGVALAEMDNASGLLASIAPQILEAQTAGSYGQGRTRAGQALLDYQLRNLQDQSYDQMGDILSQVGGLGMTYGLNKNIS